MLPCPEPCGVQANRVRNIMKIKIFNVVRTQLHDETLVWSFPSFSQAQEVMFAEVASEIKIDKLKLTIENEHFVFNGYDVWKGNDYITISDGNKVEYEIKQTTMDMDMFEMQVETITDEVIVMYPACKMYRSVIMETIKSFGVNELPFFNTKDIRYFIDNDLEEALAKRAAGKIVGDYDNEFQDECFQVVADYLEGNRGLSVMLAVINGEEEAIEDVKGEINREQGKVVFNMDYVWVATSVWQDGSKFDYGENTSVYRSHDAAVAEMKKKYEEAIEVFNGQYIGEYVEHWSDDDVFQVRYGDSDDWLDMWEGRIRKIYVQD